jgi:phosphopantothenoylcysteine synthetase/decarboxylase
MQTKVKQLVVNLWNQITIILRPLLDFIDCLNFSIADNMLALMLNSWFKYLKTIFFGDQKHEMQFPIIVY